MFTRFYKARQPSLRPKVQLGFEWENALNTHPICAIEMQKSNRSFYWKDNFLVDTTKIALTKGVDLGNHFVRMPSNSSSTSGYFACIIQEALTVCLSV
jgi:hypothetical protein